MQTENIKLLLEQVKSGAVDVDAAMDKLRHLPYENVDNFAMLDHHRSMRNGFPEVIFAQGKQPDQVATIAQKLAERSDKVLITRIDKSTAEVVLSALPEMTYHPIPRLMILDRSTSTDKKPGIMVCSAGTADMPVAEEAAMTAELMNNKVDRIYDVGVAGIHRLLDKVDQLWESRVIIVAAGMDGALPSVIGGLVSVPVIAVPTSVGYGASFNGLAALLTMLNSCSTGVGVVNIDNGFGAGVLASSINQLK
ncbi:MAG: 1-(5-phosphoribosyl)-5-amino-4-imidazole-carboxylate carboxylase [Chloroflexi bacterium HGW-Chloroflexi-4]|nr:MAG: 1-(5-phosphoribosyl)-5-amino-4-imidazole-carboxylate carboxylase [Chloroflexi bacterium HGW-Chloroflexi-4]